MNITIAGKIFAHNISAALAAHASGTEIIIGCQFAREEVEDYVFYDEMISTLSLLSAIESVIASLAGYFVPIPIVTGGITGVGFPEQTVNFSKEVYLREGYYLVAPYFQAKSVAFAFGAAEEDTLADFVPFSFDPPDLNPDANEYVRINRVSLEKISGYDVPVPRFSPADTTIYAGQEVTFDASASTDHDGSVTDYYWEFSRGTPATSTSKNPTVRWDRAGVYTVRLKVRDSDGICSGFTGGTVRVEDRKATGGIAIEPGDPEERLKNRPITRYTSNKKEVENEKEVSVVGCGFVARRRCCWGDYSLGGCSWRPRGYNQSSAERC